MSIPFNRTAKPNSQDLAILTYRGAQDSETQRSRSGDLDLQRGPRTAKPNAVVRDRQIPNRTRVSLPFNRDSQTQRSRSGDLDLQRVPGTAKPNAVVRDRQIPNRTRVSLPINGTAQSNGQDRAILIYRLQAASFPIRVARFQTAPTGTVSLPFHLATRYQQILISVSASLTHLHQLPHCHQD